MPLGTRFAPLDWIDREALEAALDAPAPTDEIAGGFILRAVTLFWIFDAGGAED